MTNTEMACWNLRLAYLNNFALLAEKTESNILSVRPPEFFRWHRRNAKTDFQTLQSSIPKLVAS